MNNAKIFFIAFIFAFICTNNIFASDSVRTTEVASKVHSSSFVVDDKKLPLLSVDITPHEKLDGDILSEYQNIFSRACTKVGGKFKIKKDNDIYCYCGSLIFDFNYSVCKREIIIDKLRYPNLPTINLDAVDDFASLVKAYEKNVCDSDYLKLTKGALLVLKNAIKHFGLQWDDTQAVASSFTDQFLHHWKKILDMLDELVRQDRDFPTLVELFSYEKNGWSSLALSNIKNALEDGIISLPIFGPKSEEFFRSSALNKYFFIGIAPIAIEIISIKEIALNKHGHPFRPEFLWNAARVTHHDTMHAALLGKNLQRIGLASKNDGKINFSPSKCNQIKNIVNKLSTIKIEDNKAAKSLALPLYYYLHEDRFFIEPEFTNFAEFIYEFWQNRRRESFSELILGKNSPENKARIKDLCSQVYQNKNAMDNGIIDHDFLSAFFVPLTRSSNNLMKLGRRSIIARGVTSRLAQVCAFKYEIAPESIQNINFNLADEIRTTLASINFADDFGSYFSQWENLFQQFKIMAAKITPANLLLKWRRNSDKWDQIFK